MDRKHCVLLYSNYSKASIDLLSYIKGLPLDFPKVTGMTMICIDNEQFKHMLQKNGIEYVPTLLVEYYQGATPNQVKQKFERDYIYMWIDQVMKALHFEWPQTPHTPDQQPVGRTLRPGGSRRTDLSSVGQHHAANGHRNASRGPEVADIPPPPQDEDGPEGSAAHPSGAHVPRIQKKEKLDITALAQQMAKDRDSYISDTTPAHKKGRGPH